METTELTMEQREAALQELGLTYTAVFVPFSKSRNAGKRSLSLNWWVTISKGHSVIITDYMQGIGHVPGRGRETYDQREADKKTAETGKIWKVCSFGISPRMGPDNLLPVPTLLDVMHSLALDASVLDYATYEEWAGEFGYNADSRKGEAIYRQCLEIALKLRAMLGEGGLRKLQEITNGY